ncbi:hypothetical protein E4U09_000542, partial [Claviceps aff. purpurea]
MATYNVSGADVQTASDQSDHIRMAQDPEPRLSGSVSRPHDGTSQEETLFLPYHCRMETTGAVLVSFLSEALNICGDSKYQVTKGGRPNSARYAGGYPFETLYI